MSRTRRRMSARMTISPTSASTTRSRRRPSGDSRIASTGPRAPVHERGLARELADLGEELAGALGDDGHVAPEPVAARHVDRARREHEHARACPARLEQKLAVGVGARLAEGPQPLDLLGRQLGEGLGPPGRSPVRGWRPRARRHHRGTHR
jgi:hypothetical protein